PTSLVPPLGSAHGFAYTPVDLNSTYTPPALPGGPTPTGYPFDADGDLTRVTRPDAVLGGRGAQAADPPRSSRGPAATLGPSYRAASRPAGLPSPSGAALAYAYDGALITGSAVSGSVAGSVGLAYDTAFRPAAVSVNGANSIAMG